MKLSRLFPLTILMLSIGLMSATIYNFSNIEIGQEAPLLTKKMENIDGSEKAISDLKKENGVIVVFSCNTCPFVVGSEGFAGWEKTYNDLAKYAAKQKLGFVLVNSNEAKRDKDDSMEAMKERAKQKKYIMPYLLDKQSELANAFGAKTTPHVYLLDKNLKVVYMGSIDNSWDKSRKEDIPYLKNAISQIGKGQNIETTTTAPKGCSIKRK